MTIYFFGTSNCITTGSFVQHLSEQVVENVQNYSVGASSSLASLYYVERCQFNENDIVFMDYVINDSGYLWNNLKNAGEIETTLSTFVSKVRSKAAIPVIIIVPSESSMKQASPAEEVHVSFCKRNMVPYINIAKKFRLLSEIEPKMNLFNDPAHMSTGITPYIAKILANAINELRDTPSEYKVMTMSIMESRAILCENIFNYNLISRSSSFYKSKFFQLNIGKKIEISLKPSEGLAALMINTGALGGNLQVDTSELRLVKPLTIYWDVARPDWFTAILTDFRIPVTSKSNSLTLSLADINAQPTEQTLHLKDPIQDRHGQLEIEGFLMTTTAVERQCNYKQYQLTDLDLFNQARFKAFLEMIE